MNLLSDYLRAQRMTEEASVRENGVWFSEPEIRLAEELTQRGFAFEQQKRVSRGHGSAILDFLVQGVLAVEIDGREFHEGAKDAHRDHDVMIHHGIWTLRVPGWKAKNYPDEVVSLIALKLSELGIEPL